VTKPLLTPQVRAFIHAPISVVAVTRDASLRPSMARGFMARCHPAEDVLTLYLSTVPAAPLLRDLRDNGQIAVGLGGVLRMAVIQAKGRMREIRDPSPAELTELHGAAEALFQVYTQIGISRTLTRALRLEPATAVEFQVTDLFDQSPGPGAGERLVTL
jgi:hypothetical protein